MTEAGVAGVVEPPAAAARPAAAGVLGGGKPRGCAVGPKAAVAAEGAAAAGVAGASIGDETAADAAVTTLGVAGQARDSAMAETAAWVGSGPLITSALDGGGGGGASACGASACGACVCAAAGGATSSLLRERARLSGTAPGADGSAHARPAFAKSRFRSSRGTLPPPPPPLATALPVGGLVGAEGLLSVTESSISPLSVTISSAESCGVNGRVSLSSAPSVCALVEVIIGFIQAPSRIETFSASTSLARSGSEVLSLFPNAERLASSSINTAPTSFDELGAHFTASKPASILPGKRF